MYSSGSYLYLNKWFFQSCCRGLVSRGYTFQSTFNMFSCVIKAVKIKLHVQLSFRTDLGSARKTYLHKTWNAEISIVRWQLDLKRLDPLESTVAEVFGSPEAAVRKVPQASTWHWRYRTASTFGSRVSLSKALGVVTQFIRLHCSWTSRT